MSSFSQSKNHYMTFYLMAILFFLSVPFPRYSLLKYANLDIGFYNRTRSNLNVLFKSPYITSYWVSVVSLSICHCTMPLATFLDGKSNGMPYTLVKDKHIGSISNRFCVVHRWVIHTYILSVSHVKDREILSFLPWNSPSSTQILNAKITKAHSGHQTRKK